MSTGGRGGGRQHRRGFRPMAEINVTPMVDVMLVLLIIFMVTAPLLTAGVEVDLPKTSSAPLKGDDQPLAVSIRADGTIWVQDTQVQLDDLAPRLTAIAKAKTDTRIFVRGDKAINYGRVMEVMGSLHTAGFTKVALLTAPAPESAPRRGAR